MSTRSKQPRNDPPRPPAVRRVTGYLSCKTCERTVPFTGAEDSDLWPQHRCGLDVKPFDDFTKDEPYKTLIPRRDWKDWPR